MPPESQESESERPPAFQSSFYYAVAVLLTFLGSFAGGTAFGGIPFLFGLIGWLKARDLPSSILGFVIAGATGGHLALEIWIAYF